MASAKQPTKLLSDPIADFRIPLEPVAINERDKVPERPAETLPREDIEREKTEVVVPTSRPVKTERVRVLADAHISWGHGMLRLPKGTVLDAKHYEPGSFDKMRACGVKMCAEDIPDDEVEMLAIDIHESFRDAVTQGNVVCKSGVPFKSWDEIDESAREGRRISARYLLSRYLVTVKG